MIHRKRMFVKRKWCGRQLNRIECCVNNSRPAQKPNNSYIFRIMISDTLRPIINSVIARKNRNVYVWFIYHQTSSEQPPMPSGVVDLIRSTGSNEKARSSSQSANKPYLIRHSRLSATPNWYDSERGFFLTIYQRILEVGKYHQFIIIVVFPGGV